jgi:phosphotransferase family enzyme
MTANADPPRVAASVEELIAGATERRVLTHADSKSGAPFERVVIDGRPYVLKHLHVDHDWLMRAGGDISCWPVRIWSSGLLDRLPSTLDDAVVGAATGLGRNGWGAALLMRDVGEFLVPEGDGAVSLPQHRGFLDHMAALHATYWGWEDDLGLLPLVHRYTMFSPVVLAEEPHPVAATIRRGWEQLLQLDPRIAADLLDLAYDPTPLLDATGRGPEGLVHGDWKMGNLGTRPDGTTILLDWAFCGRASPLSDLAWYVSLNAARLPEPKPDAVAAYRAALERHGVDTAGWWVDAVRHALLGAMVQFGWEKALGGAGPELDWWMSRAEDGLRAL